MMEDPVDQTEAQETGEAAGQAEAADEAKSGAEAAADQASESSSATPASSPITSTKRWYVVHAYSGFEKNVARTLQERVELSNLKEFFGEILVPTEEVVEMRAGQKRRSERKFFPGYVLVQMELNDDTWHLVKETPRVMGFIGGKADQPAPLTEAEANAILDRVAAGSEKATPKTVFEPGEIVRVIDGPFNDFSGVVEEVNYEKNRLHVAVTILGRSTPVELDFDQVEKG
jgi:transcriptional antiterminator NusG